MSRALIVMMTFAGVLLTGGLAATVGGSKPFYALQNGDTNGDWDVDLSDAVYFLGFLFNGGPEPVPIACGLEPASFQNGDVNGDGDIDLSDGIYLLGSLFLGGPAPVTCDGLHSLGAGAGGNPNARIVPHEAHPYGHSYSEWQARWWQWAFSIPASTNPLTDLTGERCGVGQSGPVWFLGGVFNVSGQATRDLCVVPSGKALFFPLLNFEADNFICVDPDTSFSAAELEALATSIMDTTTNLACEIDGRSVQDLASYRGVSPPFSATLPDTDDLGQAGGCTDSYPRVIEPIVDDGFYLMLAPLSAGPHTIHFHGTVGLFNFTLDVTYHLTVGG